MILSWAIQVRVIEEYLYPWSWKVAAWSVMFFQARWVSNLHKNKVAEMALIGSRCICGRWVNQMLLAVIDAIWHWMSVAGGQPRRSSCCLCVLHTSFGEVSCCLLCETRLLWSIKALLGVFICVNLFQTYWAFCEIHTKDLTEILPTVTPLTKPVYLQKPQGPIKWLNNSV